MITAMTIIIVLAIAAMFLLLTLHEVITEDRGRRSPPPSRFEDPQFRPPSSHL